MKKELKSGILSADKSADHRPINRPTVGEVNVIAVGSDKCQFRIIRTLKAVCINEMHGPMLKITYASSI